MGAVVVSCVDDTVGEEEVSPNCTWRVCISLVCWVFLLSFARRAFFNRFEIPNECYRGDTVLETTMLKLCDYSMRISAVSGLDNQATLGPCRM